MQEAHIAKLKSSLDADGDASLQNALTLCVDSLKSIPPYGHREVGCRCLLRGVTSSTNCTHLQMLLLLQAGSCDLDQVSSLERCMLKCCMRCASNPESQSLISDRAEVG